MSSKEKRITCKTAEATFAIDLTNENKDLESFPHPFHNDVDGNGVGHRPKTLVELNMMHLSAAIRSKTKWYEKMKDETIRNKWKQEALQQNLLSDKQIDYVLAELEYYDSIRDHSMEMSTVDGAWQSDELVTDEIKQSLIQCVRSLEDVAENEKDWHPGTNKQVLDLVHPSLFCYVNQMTRVINEKDRTISLTNVLEHIGEGEMIDWNEKENSSKQPKTEQSTAYTKSRTYQWLPAEFNVSENGQVTIDSYINNLHPVENKELYQIIGEIFQRFVPLFNKTLTNLVNNQNQENRIQVDPYGWYDESSSPDDDDDDEEDYYNSRPIKIPDVEEFHMTSSITPTIDLRGRKLQVIVKLANIILTPDNPIYSGGVWHVEGMNNEHIVASGIYYYSSSNLTQSNLQFRTVIDGPAYEQYDDRGVRLVYGLANNDPLNQTLGEIITQEDRCIVFPNIYQHRVAPFQLQDPTQRGERKILVFFLVDPSIRVLSTAHVPPQQSHWLMNIVFSMFPFKDLPSLVLEKIMSYVNFPMSMYQAKQHREKLMAERKYFISQNNELLFERPFSLCEH